jgi:hypothetical protein
MGLGVHMAEVQAGPEGRLGPVRDGDAAVEVGRFLDLCRLEGEQPAWVDPIRSAQRHLYDQMDGRAWVIEVDMAGMCRRRMAILKDGFLMRSLEPGDVVDVRINGEPETVAGFLLGHMSVDDAIIDGVLVPSPTVKLGRVRRVSAIVSAQLRELVNDPAATPTGDDSVAVEAGIASTTTEDLVADGVRGRRGELVRRLIQLLDQDWLDEVAGPLIHSLGGALICDGYYDPSDYDPFPVAFAMRLWHLVGGTDDNAVDEPFIVRAVRDEAERVLCRARNPSEWDERRRDREAYLVDLARGLVTLLEGMATFQGVDVPPEGQPGRVEALLSVIDRLAPDIDRRGEYEARETRWREQRELLLSDAIIDDWVHKRDRRGVSSLSLLSFFD